MRNTIPLFAIVTALLLLSGCRKSPALETASVPFFSGSVEALVSLKSVSFTASFTGLDPAKAENCGFEWSENPARTAFSVNAITDRYGKMKASAVVKLNEGTEYQVRAWVLTGSKKFYSAPSLFYGVVAVRPEIVSLGRTYALWSDSVRIRVRNLSADIRPQDVKVIIQYTELQPVSVDTNEIVVLMPYIQDKGKLKLRVLANGHEFANSTEIENALPAITSVDPGWIHYGDTIHVKGNFRAEYAGRLIPVASYDLSYELLTFTNSEITLKVPPDPYCSQSLNIDFNILSAQGGIEKHYYFTGFGVSRFGHWSKLNYALPEMGAKSVLFNNEAYMIEYSVYTGSAPFWKYNPATDQWTALNDYPAPGGANQTLVVCNGELYSGFATNGGQNTNFFRYSRLNNNWVSRAQLPVTNFNGCITTFVNSGKIYAFLGGSNKKGIYNPSTDSWTMSDCVVPSFSATTSVFNYMGDYYFYKSATNSILYKFDLLTETFSVVDIPGLSDMSACFFMLNNRFYCTNECKVYELDMPNKQLIYRPEFSNFMGTSYNTQFYQDIAYQFVFNNKAYFLFEPHNLLTFSTANK